jgi:hypothetical protein
VTKLVLIGGRQRLLADQNPSTPVLAPLFLHQQSVAIHGFSSVDLG